MIELFQQILMGSAESASQQGSPIRHEMFRDARLLVIKEEKYIETKVHSEKEDWERWNERLSSVHFDYIYLMLPVSNQFQDKSLCGTSGVVSLQYEFYPNLLRDQIEKRNAKKAYFQETDLWFLLYCISAAQQEMWNKANKSLMDVRPGNIFISDEGDIKVFSSVSCPGVFQGLFKPEQEDRPLLAPEQMSERYQHTPFSLICSELFSIGLTLLSASELYDSQHIYNQLTSINWKEFDNAVFKWKSCSRYSEVFKAVVLSLLSSNAEDRTSPFQLWAWLQQYREPILEKEEFTIDILPGKIERKIIQIRRFLRYREQSQSRKSGSFANQSHQMPLQEQNGNFNLTNAYPTSSQIHYVKAQRQMISPTIQNYSYSNSSLRSDGNKPTLQSAFPQYYAQVGSPSSGKITPKALGFQLQASELTPMLKINESQLNWRQQDRFSAPYVVHPSSKRVISTVYLHEGED